MKKPSITIFGEGRVGSTLIKSFIQSGYSVKSSYGSSNFPNSIDEMGDFIFLCVPDRKIEGLAKTIGSEFQDLKGKTFVHCSGSLSSDILNSVSSNEVSFGSFHPIKAVTHGQNSFENVWFEIEGNHSTLETLKQIADDFNAHSFEISKEAKPLLHAAAVVSSNYLVTLLHIAVKISEEANIDAKTALQVLLPLSKSTLDNIKEKGINAALTGPIARGDTETLKKHQSVLSSNEALSGIYNQLGKLTVPITTDIDDNKKNEMLDLFNSEKG